MRKVLSLSLTAIIFGITSCNPAKQFETELAGIDSLQTLIADSEEKYDAINFDTLAYMEGTSQEMLTEIKRLFRDDTISNELAKAVTQFKGVSKQLKGAKGKKMIFGDELNMLKYQLNNLRDDILSGALNKEEVQNYLQNERKAVGNFLSPFNDFYFIQEIKSKDFISSKPTIDSLINALRTEASEDLE